MEINSTQGCIVLIYWGCCCINALMYSKEEILNHWVCWGLLTVAFTFAYIVASTKPTPKEKKDDREGVFELESKPPPPWPQPTHKRMCNTWKYQKNNSIS